MIHPETHVRSWLPFQLLLHNFRLARSLQRAELEEAAAAESSLNSRPSTSRRTSASALSHRGLDQGDILIEPQSDDELEAANRAAIERLQRRYAGDEQRSQSPLADYYPATASSSSSSSAPRSRDQIIRHLHNLQGTYPGLAPGRGRTATFRISPGGRLIVFVDGDEQQPHAQQQQSNSTLHHPLDDAYAARVREYEEEEEERAALQEYERLNAERLSGQSRPPGLLGLVGSMLHRYASGRHRGIPFPLSLFLDSNASSSNSSGRSRLFGGSGRGAEVDIERMSYDDLLQLEEALGSVKPRVKAANREEIEQLPVGVYRKPNNSAAAPAAASSSDAASAATAAASSSSADSSSVDQCSICLCDFEDGDSLKTLPCLHRYHAACVDQWLQINEKCPICQTPASQIE